MQFIIYVAGRIRNGQRVGLSDFPYSEAHGKYIYQGRELTLEEFNAAAEIVFQTGYRNNGYGFCPLAIDPEAQARRQAKAEAQAEAVAAAAEQARIAAEEAEAARLAEEEAAQAQEPAETDAPVEPSPEDPADAPRYRLVGNDIFMGEERIAGIYENGLRCAKGYADHRDEIEAWLNTQPQ